MAAAENNKIRTPMPARQPGERRLQILHALAEMLEQPSAEKITTASLAARLQVSEAALYRHFASKAQMFEGLIEFIETSVFGVINKISSEQEQGMAQVESVIALLLGFAEKNPGMTRVLTGDALINEDARLQSRINQLHDRLESSLKQGLRVAAAQGQIDGSTDTAAAANLLLCFCVGRWQLFAKSGFKRRPAEAWAAQWQLLQLGLRNTPQPTA
jgi:TetR/AcrR family transcriptional regulator